MGVIIAIISLATHFAAHINIYFITLVFHVLSVIRFSVLHDSQLLRMHNSVTFDLIKIFILCNPKRNFTTWKYLCIFFTVVCYVFHISLNKNKNIHPSLCRLMFLWVHHKNNLSDKSQMMFCVYQKFEFNV